MRPIRYACEAAQKAASGDFPVRFHFQRVSRIEDSFGGDPELCNDSPKRYIVEIRAQGIHTAYWTGCWRKKTWTWIRKPCGIFLISSTTEIPPMPLRAMGWGLHWQNESWNCWGSITVKSEIGNGSIFAVKFPLDR